jgi:hypothetical protein
VVYGDPQFIGDASLVVLFGVPTGAGSLARLVDPTVHTIYRNDKDFLVLLVIIVP